MAIDASYGLGEALVGGMVDPDNYCLKKEPTLKIVKKKVSKKTMMIRNKSDGTSGVENVEITDPKVQTAQVLTDKQILELAKIAISAEKAYKCVPQGFFYIFLYLCSSFHHVNNSFVQILSGDLKKENSMFCRLEILQPFIQMSLLCQGICSNHFHN